MSEEMRTPKFSEGERVDFSYYAKFAYSPTPIEYTEVGTVTAVSEYSEEFGTFGYLVTTDNGSEFECDEKDVRKIETE